MATHSSARDAIRSVDVLLARVRGELAAAGIDHAIAQDDPSLETLGAEAVAAEWAEYAASLTPKPRTSAKKREPKWQRELARARQAHEASA